MNKDADFFAKNNIIDYSLLLGVHENNLIQTSMRSEITAYDVESEDISIIQSKTGDKIFFFGIIDILTSFKYLLHLNKCLILNLKLYWLNSVSSFYRNKN